MSGARRRAGAGDTRYLPEVVREVDKEEQTLLVFGYQCKTFRDDDKAMFIDRKKHLIPWMGDSSLMIDRYDGRGHLYDLKPFDADVNKGKYDEPTDEEKRIEALIDEERYLELHTDVAERAMYEEEELKRLNEEVGGSYGAVNFNYEYGGEEDEETAQPQQQEEEEATDDSDSEEPFEAPDALKVPYGMAVPTTIKQNAIIEKTAQFVSKQGAQMEIVIKTKQQNNPSFEFLHFNHEWNPYYKHMVRMIKSGLYKPQEVKRKRLSSGSEDGKYLHPALMTGGAKQAAALLEEPLDSMKFLESVKAKLPSGQISNTVYSKLVSNISKHSGRDSPIPTTRGSNGEVNSAPPVGETQYDSAGYPAAPDYPAGEDGNYGATYTGVPPPPGMEPVTLPPPPGTQPPPPGTEPVPYVEDAHSSESQGYDAHYQDPYYSSSYDYQQHTTSASAHPTQYQQSTGYTAQHTIEQGPQPYSVPEQPQEQPHAQVQAQPKPRQRRLVEYGPDTEQEPAQSEQVEDPDIVYPPPDIQPVIDKMASYVAKNGPAFEFVVKNKADGRFDFVHSWHQHNAYYEHRKKVYGEENEVEKKLKAAEEKQRQEEEDALSGGSKAVTFTMKAKKIEKTALKTKTALVYESSDDDEDSDTGEGKRDREGDHSDSGSLTPSHVPVSSAGLPSSLSANSLPGTLSAASLPGIISANSSIPGTLSANSSSSNLLAAEQTSPTPVSAGEESKTAEDKLKDKLAMAARDKLAATNKEKLIQAERKRKAAMFAAMLKSSQQEPAQAQQQGAGAAQGEPPSAEEPIVGPSLPAQLPATKGAAIPPPLSLLTSSSPTTSRSTSPAVSAAPKDSKSSTPARSHRSKSPTEKYYKKRKSRSRSPRKKRSGSKDRSRRSRSRSDLKLSRRHKSRSRSRTPKKRRRSKSRSKSPRRRKRSKSPSSKTRKSPSRRKRSRSRSASPTKAKKKKTKRSRSRSRTRRSRSKSKSKSSKHKSPSKKKSKKKKKAKSRSKSRSRSVSKGKQTTTVITGEENSDDVIEIKSESGEDVASSAPGEEETPTVGEAQPTATFTLGGDTSDNVVESTDQEEDKDTSAETGALSPAPVPHTGSATNSAANPAVSPAHAATSRLKPVVDMFESDENSQGAAAGNSGTTSPAPASSVKRNVSNDMLLKVRAMLKASRAAMDDT